MTGAQDPERGPRFTDEELAWIAAHRGELRRGVSERRYRYWILCTGLAIGLAVHIVGFLLKSSATGEPIAVLADLLYTFGWALWTAVVVVTLIETIPAAKDRQVIRWLEAAEAELRSRARAKDERRPAQDLREQR